jgi:glutaredoxin
MPSQKKRKTNPVKKPSPQFSVFISVGCSYCTKAIHLLESQGKSFEVFSVHDQSIHDYLNAKIPNYHTVPQIFEKGRHIGGFTELNTLLSTKASAVGGKKSTAKKYQTRTSPPYSANEAAFRNSTQLGNDGRPYVSVPNKNSIYRWVLAK